MLYRLAFSDLYRADTLARQLSIAANLAAA
jgi:hypothetical protein